MLVLAPIVLAQWLGLVAFALTVRHNGWLYYQGGDETFYYTTSWLLTGWQLPTTAIGYGWSFLTTPIALFAGPNVLDGMPAIIVLNAVVLGPVATLCVYGIASRLGGRLLGYWAAACWVAAPYAVIPLWDHRYHQKWVELFLPQALGLTNLGDYPSMVALLVAAYFCFRALDGRDVRDGLVAGLATGFAVGIKPANGLFVAAPLLGFLLARRWRQLVPFVGALGVTMITLAIWKQRGLGENPALASGSPALAYMGFGGVPLAFLHPVTKYVHVDWGQIGHNLDVLREFFWSVRPLEYLPIAGAAAVALRQAPKAAFLGAWFFAYFFVKGSSPHASVEDASFFRLMMPGFPAYLLLGTALPLLVPTYAARASERFRAAEPRWPRNQRRFAAVVVVFALVPLLMVATLRAQRTAQALKVYPDGLYLPIDSGFRVDARAQTGRVELSWPARNGSATAFYRVYRAPAFAPDPVTAANPPIVEGMKCRRGSHADCFLEATVVAVTTTLRAVDERVPRGRWTYYVAAASNWLGDPTLGDPLVLGKPVTVSVG